MQLRQVHEHRVNYCAQQNAARDGRVSLAASYRVWFPATQPRVFYGLKIVKTVILFQQIIQEKFA